MISIIIPLYNQSKQLDKCLESIAAQTYDNYEIIVVNDRSKDRLSSIYHKYRKKFGLKMEWINNQSRHGAPYSRNKGFNKSKGEYVLFCDADVIMDNNMLRIMLDALKSNPDCAYAYSSFKFGKKKFSSYPFNKNRLRAMPYIHTTSLLRRVDFPGFDEDLKRLQDWDLWLTLAAANHNGIWINKVLFKVQAGGTMSSWLPSSAYKLLPFLPKVKAYNEAVAIIKEKHGLN